LSRLAAYTKKHQRPYTLRAKNGKGEIQILFYDGYITIRSFQPGLHYATEIHIKRKAWIKLLTTAVKVTRIMEGPSFDRYRAERRYYREEAKFDAELRAQKRQRQGRRQRRT
jgi:hypothetical protein